MDEIVSCREDSFICRGEKRSLSPRPGTVALETLPETVRSISVVIVVAYFAETAVAVRFLTESFVIESQLGLTPDELVTGMIVNLSNRANRTVAVELNGRCRVIVVIEFRQMQEQLTTTTTTATTSEPWIFIAKILIQQNHH